MTDLVDTGGGASAEDLGDPIEDPDGDDEDVKTTLPPGEEEGLEHAGAGPAPACRAALDQATQLFPSRSRASDGIMGDPSHQKRKSDHNQGNAFDLTHDPANGCDAHGLVEGLRQRRDPRVKYIISNARIWNPSIKMDWRPYNGSNPHRKHAHVSILTSARGDTAPWWGPVHRDPPKPCPFPEHPELKQGAQGDIVRHLQDLLSKSGHPVGVDGDFGQRTDEAVRGFQRARALRVDGVVGRNTWSRVHEVVNEHI